MAITKILYRNGGLAQAIQYITNPDKTDQCVLVDHFNCDPGFAYQQMMNTKRRFHKTDGRQCYHIIQSFKPDEITPELAHEIAKRFAAEHLRGYEAVIGTHVDKGHIHSHIVFNSVNADTGIKYHSTLQNYYQQIRGISDRLCAENGLSVILQGERTKTVSYIEWLRQSKGQPTFRSMLEADLRDAIADANDLGHFFLLMEHKDTRSIMETGSASVCAGKNGICIQNAKTRHIRKKTSSAPLRGISQRLKPVSDRHSSSVRSRSHIARIQSTRDSLLFTIITAICLDASKSGSIRRA